MHWNPKKHLVGEAEASLNSKRGFVLVGKAKDQKEKKNKKWAE